MSGFILLKGLLPPDGGPPEISWCSKDLDEETKENIKSLISNRVPSFVLASRKETRTIFLEDDDSVNFLKFFKQEDDKTENKAIDFLFIKISGREFTDEEKQKLSVKLSQALDKNLDAKQVDARVQEIVLNIEAFDFMRPIKERKIRETIATKDDLQERLDQILPKLTQLRYADTIEKQLQHAKLKIIASSRSGSTGDEKLKTFEEIKEPLLAALGNALDPREYAMAMYNLGLVAKTTNMTGLSNKFFQEAQARFSEIHFETFAIFSRFQQFLNLKSMKRLDEAIGIIEPTLVELSGSTTITNGFKGVVFRHFAELLHVKGQVERAIQLYKESLAHFERDQHATMDTALAYAGLATLQYNQEDFINSCKHFSFAINMLHFLKQDATMISKNLGVSYLSLATEYMKAIKVLLVERDASRAIDILYKGISYFCLAGLNLGSAIMKNGVPVLDAFMKQATILGTIIAKEEKDMLDKIEEALVDYNARLRHYATTDNQECIVASKMTYEKLRALQPLRVYYMLVVFKTNGLSVFTKRSAVVDDLPTFDGDLIAGLISGISSFLSEVLTGEEELSLIDRNNIKIIFEHTSHLMGILFTNKDNPRMRDDLKQMLEQVESEKRGKLDEWNGNVSEFDSFKERSKILIP